MLEDLIAEALEKAGRQWRVEGELIQPSANDVRTMLDWAASELYTRDVGTRLETGGLIFDKTEIGINVFVIAGFYS